jgi:hypothetical protein
MYVKGYFEDDEYLYVDVDTIKAGIRPSDYALALTDIEMELDEEGVQNVLIGPWSFENKLDVVLDEDYFEKQGNLIGFESGIPDDAPLKRSAEITEEKIAKRLEAKKQHFEYFCTLRDVQEGSPGMSGARSVWGKSNVGKKIVKKHDSNFDLSKKSIKEIISDAVKIDLSEKE